MSSISLCMIVKNEEKVLETCLNSVKDVVDEIIIIDTGSTDRTQEIAKKYGARIEHFVWGNDFSAARNYAKSFATKEWILQLDADEYFVPSEAIKIKECIRNASADAFSIQIENLDESGNVGVTHFISRIFRNKPHFLYSRRIHEQMMDGDHHLRYEKANISLKHTGYIKAIIKEKNKTDRNLQLLLAEYEENPNDSFTLLNLANQYYSFGKYKEVQKYAQASFNLGANTLHRPFSLFRFIDSTVQLNQWEKALQIANEGERIMGYTSGDILHYKGVISQKLGFIQDAIYFFTKRLNHQRTDETQWFHLNKTKLELAKIQIRNRDTEQGLTLLKEVVGEDPYHLNQSLLFLDVLARHKSIDELIQVINEYFGTNSPKDRVTRFKIALTLRDCQLLQLYHIPIEFNQFTVFESAFAISMQNEKFLLDFEAYIHNQIIRGDITSIVVGIIYARESKNQKTIELLSQDKTAIYLLGILEKSESISLPKRINNKIVELLLQELLARGRHDDVNELLGHIQQNYETFAEILDYYEFDNVAIAFYIEQFRIDNRNTKTAIRLAELLYAAGMFEEGILFLSKINQFNHKNARVHELLIRGYLKENQTEAAKAHALIAEKEFNDSLYFKKVANLP